MQNGQVVITDKVEQTQINNMDLRWELFQNSGQKFSVSGFYKQFTNPIEVVAFSEVSADDVTPRNVGNATVLGAELEFRKNLDFLSPNLRSWTAGANITVVDAKVELDKSPGGEYESRLANARRR